MTDKKLFQVPAVITKISTMSKCLRLHVDSQDNISGESMKVLFDLLLQLGWFTMSVHQIEAEDIVGLPGLKALDKRSPGQRLRAVFFRIWEQQYKGDYEKFDDYYEYMMERLIESYKEKLE